jgi:hypothetical protein
MDYTSKSYGRNEEVAAIYKLIDAGADISMPGPRRLGKTFVLDRLVEAGSAHRWEAIKVEVAGCKDPRGFFRQLCDRIGKHRSPGKNTIDWLRQRLGQAIDPCTDTNGPWYQPFISLDHQTYFERLIKALHEDPNRRWLLLIDELPIFLKALHDQGPQGIEAARTFMNHTSRLRVDYPNVRWLITGSIGLEPLAQAGNYMGVLAKFQTYGLMTLSEIQARDFVIDLAQTGRLADRQLITATEADAIVKAVGWRTAFYLEALSRKFAGTPTENAQEVDALIEAAMARLLQPFEVATFGVWEEHLRKHYPDTDRAIAIAVLNALAQRSQGLDIDAVLAVVGQPGLTRDALRKLLMRLDAEGFITIEDWGVDNPVAAFRNVLLRRWWTRFPPQANT